MEPWWKIYLLFQILAGIDSVGTNMFCVSDINMFLVEPLASIGVFNDFNNITSNHNYLKYVSKIRTSEDIEYIKSNMLNLNNWFC